MKVTNSGEGEGGGHLQRFNSDAESVYTDVLQELEWEEVLAVGKGPRNVNLPRDLFLCPPL